MTLLDSISSIFLPPFGSYLYVFHTFAFKFGMSASSKFTKNFDIELKLTVKLKTEGAIQKEVKFLQLTQWLLRVMISASLRQSEIS